jgi:hypothetical protein
MADSAEGKEPMMAKWLPPNGFTGKVHQMDAKVGGAYKARSLSLLAKLVEADIPD